MNKKLLFFLTAVLLSMASAFAQVSVWNGTRATWTKGNGTETNPYLIENARQLAYLAYYVNDGVNANADNIVGVNTYWKLTINIDLNWLDWTPIGYTGTGYYFFGGHFDGGEHTITSLYVDVGTNVVSIGLFGRINGGSVKNIRVEGYILGGGQTGGIIGWAAGTITIDNCYYAGSVCSRMNSGGIIGCINAGNTSNIIINNCHNTGEIFSGSHTSACSNSCIAGGIVGYIATGNVIISNCHNIGNVSAYFCFASPHPLITGGIVGGVATDVIISNCHNAGIVSSSLTISSSYNYIIAGGIVGYIVTGNVIIGNCHNTELIAASDYYSPNTFDYSMIGGIIGYIVTGNVIINNCCNTGKIGGLERLQTERAGGIVGAANDVILTIDNCYNTGEILYVWFYNFRGGILGWGGDNNISTLKNCYNSGSADYGIVAKSSGTLNIYNSHYCSADFGGMGTPQTEAFMKTQEFVDILNNGPTPNSAYTLDVPLINNGFPILNWQIDNTVATLSTLTVSEGILTPGFNRDTFNYTVDVSYSVASISISATATDPNATVTGTGVQQLATGANHFTITVTAEDGVTTETYTITVIRADVGVDEHRLSNITLHPNPTTGELTITNYELGITSVEIYDIYGRKISSHHLILSSSYHLINISHLPAGIYFLKIGNETVKVVKQ